MRKIIIGLTLGLVVLLLGYTGYRSFLVWKQSHGMQMAKTYLARKDMRNAILAVQQVLKANPRNIEACRMMAGLLEALGQPSALLWRERVVELSPASRDDRLTLVQAALASKNYPLATNTLAGISAADKETVAYQNVAGAVASAGGQLDEAADHFSKAVQLDPSDPLPQMNLAVLRLHRTNALDLAESRITLQRVILSTNSVLRDLARRELIADAMRFKDFPTAINLARDLAQQTNSPFTDKVLQLGVLKTSLSPEFKPTLARYQNEAATNVSEAYSLATWQIVNLQASEALDWLRQVPAQTRTNSLVEERMATCLLLLNDWKGLQSFIQQQNWNDGSQPFANFEFKRHAFIARSLRGQGLNEASAAEWAVAIKSISDQRYQIVQKTDLQNLFELAVAWKWNTEAEQILWTVVNQYPEEKWAFPILRTALVSWHRTKSLMQLLDIMAKRDPNDFSVKNDLAATALLLGAQEMRPYDLAQQVYEKDPKNPSYASTYAFALYQQGKYPAALKVMQQLSPKELQDPTTAGYYAVILKANGNKADARSYLNLASKGQLLPEEQALFDQARAGL